MMQKVIVGEGGGRVVTVSPSEEAKIRAEWLKNEAEARVEAKKNTVRSKRIAAIEKVLERFLEANADIPEVAEYLAERDA